MGEHAVSSVHHLATTVLVQQMFLQARGQKRCILQDASSGKKYCALSCLLPGSCPSGAKCARIGGLTGVCVYPTGTLAPPEKVLEVHRGADLFTILETASDSFL